MNKILTSPYDLVAKVLEINKSDLSESSTMGETTNWDSLKHIEIIGELEQSYGISIPNEDIEKYITMKAIIELYQEKSGNVSLGKRFKNFLKRVPIIKIFIK